MKAMMLPTAVATRARDPLMMAPRINGSTAEHPTPPGAPYALLSSWGIGVGLCTLRRFLDRLRGFSRLLWCLYGGDPRRECGDDPAVLAVGFLKGSNAVLQLRNKKVRTVGRLVAGRTRLVVGRTAVLRDFEQDVNRPALPFYGESAAANASAHGLGADPQDLGGLGHGRTSYGRRTVFSHAPILDPSEAPCRRLEAILAPLRTNQR
jgi:hypothetical protein